MRTQPFSTLIDFRIDVSQGPQGTGEAAPRTVAHDYQPVTLSQLGMAGEQPSSALDSLQPGLAETAWGLSAAAGGGGGRDTAALLAAVVRAPLVSGEATSGAEIGSELTSWREIARLPWPYESGSDAEREAAYGLIGALAPRLARVG